MAAYLMPSDLSMSISGPAFRFLFDGDHERICVSMGMERKVERPYPIAIPSPQGGSLPYPSMLRKGVPIFQRNAMGDPFYSLSPCPS